MQRDLDQLEAGKFDVLVIGGGIYGVFVARDAILRGMRVCLIEANDFGSGTSHNSLKIIHGGIRYFQHLNFKRVYQSIREREIWSKIASRYIQPLKFVIPAYGYSSRGPMALGAAVSMHNAFNVAQNGNKILRNYPNGTLLSKENCYELVPYLKDKKITGGVAWYDGQIIDADRLLFAILKDAESRGLVLANYVKAKEIVINAGKAKGAVVVDEQSGRSFNISSLSVVNATGPWAYKLLHCTINNQKKYNNQALSKSFNIVIDSMGHDYAFGLESRRASDAVVGKSKRAYFFTPWLGKTVIGTAHLEHARTGELNVDVSEDLPGYIDEINDACPTLNLNIGKVRYVYAGFTPAEDESQRKEVSRMHRSNIIDHDEEDGIANLISVIGVKYTTSRFVAEKVVDGIAKKLQFDFNTKKTRMQSIHSEDNDSSNVYSQIENMNLQASLSKNAVADFFNTNANAHIISAIDKEMAMTLSDYLFRRINFVTRGLLGPDQIDLAAAIMAKRFGWSDSEKLAQIAGVKEKISF